MWFGGIEMTRGLSASQSVRHFRAIAERLYYVYILASASRVFYTGVTNDLKRHVQQHQQKQIAGFTQRYNVAQLMHYEVFRDVRLAIAREKQIKAWRREERVALICKHNPRWRDRSEEWSSAQKPKL